MLICCPLRFCLSAEEEKITYVRTVEVRFCLLTLRFVEDVKIYIEKASVNLVDLPTGTMLCGIVSEKVLLILFISIANRQPQTKGKSRPQNKQLCYHD